MAAVVCQQPLFSCTTFQGASRELGRVKHMLPLCGAQSSSCSIQRTLNTKAQAVTKVILGSSFASKGLSVWSGKQHLGTALAGVQQRHVLQRPARGLVTASLLGVGAPEALVIAVVALLVFGPKGLAEVARNLGKTLKTFQPTIKELQDVSREFRSTLEQEIGLDEIRNPPSIPSPKQISSPTTPATPPQADSATKPPSKDEDRPSPRAYTTDEMLKVTEGQAKRLVSEEQRKAAEEAAWGGQAPTSRPTEAAAEKPAEAEKVGSKGSSS